MPIQQRRKGRPRKRPPKPGDRVPLGLRVTPEIKAALDQAAQNSGRSQSQEAEQRLERSFSAQDITSALEFAYGPGLAGLLILIGEIMKLVGPSAGFAATNTLEGAQAWWRNPYAFDQAKKGVMLALEAMSPAGKIELPREAYLEGGPVELDLKSISENRGELFARRILLEISNTQVAAQLTVDCLLRIRKLLGEEIQTRIEQFNRKARSQTSDREE